MELEELEQDGDVNNSGVGGKNYNKKARQKEQKFVMGGEWIPGEGPAVPYFYQRQEEKRRKERRRRRSERSQNSLVVVVVVVVADRVTFED